jgi:hypothetical protein
MLVIGEIDSDAAIYSGFASRGHGIAFRRDYTLQDALSKVGLFVGRGAKSCSTAETAVSNLISVENRKMSPRALANPELWC